MRNLDFSSWRALVTTLLGLAVITLIGVGIRLLTMMTIQQRRERMNRQINERLRTLIAAYKTLGGSFTGNLAVDPAHLRDLRRHAEVPGSEPKSALDLSAAGLVVSLRAFIREALDLDPIPSDVAIPMQGPARPAAGGGREKGDKGESRQGGGSGGGGGMGMGMAAGGMGAGGLGTGLGLGSHHDDGEDLESPSPGHG